ncbi:hypothetical protein B0T18DRAFT_406349 [Schizothecium vesticola]|uniref:Uncharacterized protein n=1 Tax=Schizothecium vesticola TaxID=314040 RepID=A0AA40F1K1_9PEZI|nr:hypothetical protein B0T18DRAFT_406349 [Schizothecium vesticola]
MVFGPGEDGMSRGTVLLWRAVVVLSCLFRGSGRRMRSVCSGLSLLESCGVMLAICWICFLSLFSGVLARGLGEQEHGNHVQRRARASPINDVPRKRNEERLSSSSEVDRDGWEASHSAFGGSSTVAWLAACIWRGSTRLSPLVARCSSFAVDHLSPSRGSLLM